MKKLILVTFLAIVAIGCNKKGSDVAAETGATTMKSPKKMKKATTKAVKEQIKKAEPSTTYNMKDFKLVNDEKSGKYTVTDLKTKKVVYTGSIENEPAIVQVTPTGSYLFVDDGTAPGSRSLTIANLKTGKSTTTEYNDNKKVVVEKDGSISFYKTGKGLNNSADGTANTEIVKHLFKDGIISKTDVTDKVYMQ